MKIVPLTTFLTTARRGRFVWDLKSSQSTDTQQRSFRVQQTWDLGGSRIANLFRNGLQDVNLNNQVIFIEPLRWRIEQISDDVIDIS